MKNKITIELKESEYWILDQLITKGMHIEMDDMQYSDEYLKDAFKVYLKIKKALEIN